MALIKEETGDIRIEEVFTLKYEETEEQTEYGQREIKSPRTKNKRLVKRKSAVMLDRKCPGVVTVSKEQMLVFTRRLIDLEARIGLLEAHFSEKTHVLKVDQSTSTDSPADVPSLNTQTDCEMWTSRELSDLESRTGLLEAHFSENAHVPTVDQSTSTDSPSDPMVTTLLPSDTPSARMPQKKSCSSIHESPMQGIILPDVTLNHVSEETVNILYLNSGRPNGKPRVDRFAVLLFRRLVTLKLYQTWAGSVNYDGSRGKNALPDNLRQAISDTIALKFNPTASDWKRIRDRINEFLRNKRARFPLLINRVNIA